MLGITVPEFRLPREVIEKEISYIESCGVDIDMILQLTLDIPWMTLSRRGMARCSFAAGPSRVVGSGFWVKRRAWKDSPMVSNS